MKILKQTTAALLALALVLGILPLSSMATETENVGDGVLDIPEAAAPEVFVEETAEVVAADAPISGICGDNLTWTLVDGVLTISGTGNMYDYEWMKSPWYESRKSITSIILDVRVSSVGTYAFLHCHSLSSIVIPDSVISIGYGAFFDCRSLNSITIPDSVTSIDDAVFSSCDSLISVTIPDSITSIGEYAFHHCDSLSSITIPDSVASIGAYAFSNCDSLSSITIGNGITSISYFAFSDCDSLISIAIPGSVTSVGDYAFSDCYSLSSVTISDSVTSIGDYAFSDCYSLSSITIPDSVTSIGDAVFSYCGNLSSVTIPDSVISIGQYAFCNCDSLRNITIPDSATAIGDGAFFGCYSLSSITIPDSVTSIGDCAFSGCSGLSNITIPDSVTAIGEYAFSGCNGLTNITIPNSVTPIYFYTFSDCDSLISITIPDNVTNIGYGMFHDCDSLSSISIPNSISVIRTGAFSDCNNLKNVYYGGSEEQWKAIAYKFPEGVQMHYNCTGLGDDNEPITKYVTDYLDNSTIRINGAGSAYAYYIGDPYQDYQLTVNGSTSTVTSDASGVFRVGLGTFDTVGEQEVIVRITHIGTEILEEPLDFSATVTVTPVEYTQSWEASLDASIGAKLMAGSEFEPFRLKASLGEVGGKVGGGTAMHISRSYSSEGENLELTSDKRIKAGFTVKCGITGNVLGAKFESGLSAGAEGSDTISYGLKIKDYSADNSAQQRAVATYLLGEALFTCPGNLLVKSFYDHLAQSVYQSCGGVVIHGSASKITASSGAELAKVTVNDVEIASALESEIKASIVQAEKSGTDGNREKSMSASFNVNLSAVTPGKRAEEGEFGDNASLLSADFLGRDVKVAAKESNEGKSLEATSLSAASAEYKIIEIGVPTKAVYNKYIFKEDAMDGLLSSTSHFDDYLNKNLFVLSLADLCELADVISASNTPVIYESEIKEKFAISLPLEFGVGLGLDTDLGVTLSYLTDTSYTNATGYAVDDQIFLTSESVDLSDVVIASDWDLVEVFTNCIKSLANDAANFFKKIGDSIQQGVEDAWGWIEEKADSVKDWFVSLTCVSTEEAWGESTEIGVLGSYANFSLARQTVKPNEAYVTRSAMTIGRPFVVNVTDNATGETIGNFQEEPLEFTIRYAGEDLMAANYDAETQVISMYRYSDDGDYFEYIGGIHDAEAKTVTAAITKPGQYILAAEVIEEEGCGYELGDVNHDTKINAKDATLILQKSVGVLKETAVFCEACAEVSGDGKLNAKDSTLILQFSVGLRDNFPGQK